MTVVADLTVNGCPQDLTDTAWHAPIHTPDGRPAAAFAVTVTTPPDGTIPCRLRLDLDTDRAAALPPGSTFTLTQQQPVERLWWTAPVPEALVIVTENGEGLATEDGELLDWSEVTVLDLGATGTATHVTRDSTRDVGSLTRTSENARTAFRDLTNYPRIHKAPGWLDRQSERHERVRHDFPSVTADAHQWLTDPDILGRLLGDIIAVGLADPNRMGPRVRPTPAEARADWERLTDAVRRPPP